MRLFLMVLIGLIASPVLFAEQQACGRNAFGVFEDINCAVNARDVADKELNATYQRLLAVLSPAEAQVLRKAQRAWLSYVEADTRFVFAREGDGSSGRLAAVNIREQLTRERTEALKSWLPR